MDTKSWLSNGLAAMNKTTTFMFVLTEAED